jgi:rhamnose utilization protein RhaD (predicted bifunctional aldolase and dehydrogenase)
MRISGTQNEDYMECLRIGGNHSLKGVGWDSAVGILTVLWVRWSGDQLSVRARFSAPILTGSRAHPASYTMGTESFPGVK